MILETRRLVLREYTVEDFDGLYAILSDPETMRHYPKPYDEAGTKRWLDWSMNNYEQYGFGLWAVVRKDTGEFIGDCGLTMQNIDGEQLPEIGYHIHKDHWRQGFGSEAARAVRDWAFTHRDFDCLYSYMKYTNVGSYSTAAAAGLKKIKEYPDPEDEILYVYAITRAEWEELKEGEAAVCRIREMEACFDALRAAGAEERCKDAALREQLERLAAYYEGGLWRRDYERDEKGLLPAGLKRGVLSQDGVYDLLTEPVAE